MSYSYRIHGSMDEVDHQAWNKVWEAHGDLFTDARFVSAVETSMADSTQCWPVIIEDAAGRPAAVTCISLYRVDGALLTSPRLRRIVEGIRSLWPGYFRFRVLICGLPVSAGETPLCVAPHANRLEVLRSIEAALCELADSLRVRVVVWKEFETEEAAWLAPLKEWGYLQADSLPMNHFEPRFADFESYLRERGSKSRQKIVRSQRKLRSAGLRIVRLRGDEGFDRVYSAEVHRLYEAVLARSESKFERLPAEFFREIARRFGPEACFTVVYQEDRVVAFSCSVSSRRRFHLLFMGMEYALNQEADLYFNVMYEDLESGLRSGADDICVGQTGSAFKARLGCYQKPRAFFIQARGLLRLPLRLSARLLFPPPEVLPPPRVFRESKTPNQSPASR